MTNNVYVPSYRMYGDSKIAVSKDEGKLWDSRLRKCISDTDFIMNKWKKNIELFDKTNEESDVYDENLVWANCVGLLPELYSQSPRISITNMKKEDNIGDEVARSVENLVNSVINDNTFSDVNLKTRGKRSVLIALLTNRGCLKIGLNDEVEGSKDKMFQEYSELVDKLSEAKNIDEIAGIEGKLKVLEELIDFSKTGNMYTKNVSPFNIYVDYNSVEQNASDADWIIERDVMPTKYLQARFFKEDENGLVSEYSGKTIDKSNISVELERRVNELDGINDAFNDKYEISVVYWVWDKVKKRVLLFRDGDWSYPIWVWNDPFGLDRFFPYYFLSFYVSPSSQITVGEVDYYKSAQNEVNKINKQLSCVRKRSFDQVVFNNRYIDKDQVNSILAGKSDFIGVNLPEGVRLQDIIQPLFSPSATMPQLFDKNDAYSVINKLSSADATTRGEEYKTNTTNVAIGDYQRSRTVKIGDKKDAIEDWLGDICWGITQLCLKSMSKDDVSQIIGKELAEFYPEDLSKEEIKRLLSLRVVGETIVKPTSTVKKQQALQISQILGQFASASPAVVIVMLKILGKAFDDFVVTKDDFDTIKETIQNQMQMQQQQIQNQQQNQNVSEQDVINQLANR